MQKHSLHRAEGGSCPFMLAPDRVVVEPAELKVGRHPVHPIFAGPIH